MENADRQPPDRRHPDIYPQSVCRRIYQNVTIGEVNGRAPRIGDGCLIGAGAVLVGDIRVGNYAKIGAGAVVSADVPDYATVVAQRPRVILHDPV